MNRRIDRRKAVITGAASAAMGLALTRTGSAQIIRTGGGIAGGGLVKASEEQARAHFSLCATRFEVGDADDFGFFGAIQWVDNSADFRMVSQSIESYGPVDGGAEGFREIRGTAMVWSLSDEDWNTPEAGSGETRPFVIRTTDAGDGPGTGNDEIALFIGEADTEDPTIDPFYTLTGKIDSGDIQIFEFTLPS